MIGPDDGIQALEAIRTSETAAEHDRSLAAGMEAILRLLVAEQKKLDEVEAVMQGMSHTLDRLKAELIVDHNHDVAALSAGLASMERLVASMRRSN